jgi:hypothetical protein
MRHVGQDSPATGDGTSGIVCEVRSRGAGNRRESQYEPGLDISPGIFSDEAVLAFVDEWLVPAIVDGLVRELMNSAWEDAR